MATSTQMVSEMLAISCVIAVVLIFVLSYDLQRYKSH